MNRKYSSIVLAIIFVLNDSVSSAVINTLEAQDLGSLPEYITFLDDNAIASTRSKRQVVVDASANLEVAPPIAAPALPANQPATKPIVTAPNAPAPAASPPTSDISGAAVNALTSGIDAIGQLSQVGDRIGQRLTAKLDRLQTGVDTLVSSQVDAITDLFKSGITTGVKVPTTGLKLLVAKLRLPLYVFG